MNRMLNKKKRLNVDHFSGLRFLHAGKSAFSSSGSAQGLGISTEGAGNHGPIFGEKVGIGTLWKFGGMNKAAVAFVECTKPFLIDIVLDKGAIIFPVGTVG